MTKSLVDKQYSNPELFEKILENLKKAGISTQSLSRNELSEFDEMSVRGAEVSHELATEIFLNGLSVLDVGCGMGGLCRMLADNFNCRVTGIDLSEDHIKAAEKLSGLLGLSEKTQFFRADAMELPFENDSFDVVWSQHTQMNIEDKARYYSEITRVLIKEGVLVFYDIFSRQQGPLSYPLPWADNHHLNFLTSFNEMDNQLREKGFEKLQHALQTESAIQALRYQLEKSSRNERVKSALLLMLGSTFKKKINNLLKAMEMGIVELRSGIYRKIVVKIK